jgi:hypothetical protein
MRERMPPKPNAAARNRFIAYGVHYKAASAQKKVMELENKIRQEARAAILTSPTFVEAKNIATRLIEEEAKTGALSRTVTAAYLGLPPFLDPESDVVTLFLQFLHRDGYFADFTGDAFNISWSSPTTT